MAYSDPNGLPVEDTESRWQPLSSHLKQVADLAQKLASNASADDEGFQRLARAACLLHDLGKYSENAD